MIRDVKKTNGHEVRANVYPGLVLIIETHIPMPIVDDV